MVARVVQRRSSFSDFSPVTLLEGPSPPPRSLTPRLPLNDSSGNHKQRTVSFRAVVWRLLFSKQPGLPDISLQASLNKKIEDVPGCIEKTRDAFKLVQQNVLAIEIGENNNCWKELRSEWDDIAKTFEAVLSDSRDLAMSGKQLIVDFFNNVVPPLLRECSTKDEKIQALEQYAREIETGRTSAVEMANAFHELRNRIGVFRAMCLAHANRLKEELKASIDKSERELSNLNSCVKNAVSGLAKLLPSRTKSSKSPVLLNIEQSTAELEQNADAAESNVATLLSLWAMIKLEMHTVQSSVKRTIDAREWMAVGDVTKALEYLEVQYAPLQDNLERYALALLPDQ